MGFVAPGEYSKRQLDAAGERLRAGVATSSDIRLLDNWRASHLYVINTFQSSLRARRRRIGGEAFITIAQRLKRSPTIIDKLRREPGMSLSRMHDIAGCRLIFGDLVEMQAFRSGVLSSRAGHELTGSRDRYDYVVHPKNSGYRGVHDVYKYNVRSVSGAPWNGLRIELQYRTLVQHSWATAVEISDIVNSTRLKFGEANQDISKLFLMCSEILCRALESVPGRCAGLSRRELLEEFDRLELKTRAVARLRGLTSNKFTQFARTNRFFILINYTSSGQEGVLEAEGFSDSQRAITRYAELEQKLHGCADVVLVGAQEQDAIKLAYTNYFSDASLFIELLDEALSQL